MAVVRNLTIKALYHEIERLAWDEQGLTLSGRCRRMPGVSGRVYFYVPDGYRPHFDPARAARPPASALTHVDGPLWRAELIFDKAQAEFGVPFERSGK